MASAVSWAGPSRTLGLKELDMGILTDDMKRVVREQRMGFIATVCPDGTPNLSPKGTTAVWDDDHLALCRPGLTHHDGQPPPQPGTGAQRGGCVRSQGLPVQGHRELRGEGASRCSTRYATPSRPAHAASTRCSCPPGPTSCSRWSGPCPSFPRPMSPAGPRGQPVKSGRNTGPTCTRGAWRVSKPRARDP